MASPLGPTEGFSQWVGDPGSTQQKWRALPLIGRLFAVAILAGGVLVTLFVGLAVVAVAIAFFCRTFWWALHL